MLAFRDDVQPNDPEHVRDIVTSSGFFSDEEINIAVELVTERLEKGLASGYYFIFADENGRTVGYACFGPIPGTRASYDLYWIAVHDNQRGQGIGKQLLQRSEHSINQLGGKRIYIETSSRDQYVPTRSFYINNEYDTAAVLDDFYAPGDSKYIFVKELEN
ncbi:GNAT family N-acetyltransferase [candidate division KSB1 bacterium]|nr:GNAT family N-acetyltransferase [candidate division KSB1 bacterium]